MYGARNNPRLPENTLPDHPAHDCCNSENDTKHAQ
jgi:hypothetical protein